MARPRMAWFLVGGTAVAVVAWVLLVVAVESLRLVLLAPTAKIGLEVVLALVRLFAALVLALFPDPAARPRLRWVAAGLAVLGLGGLALGYAYPVAAEDVDLNASLYASLLVRGVGAGLCAVGLVPRTPPALTGRAALAVAGAVGLLGAAVVAAAPRLPALVRAADPAVLAASHDPVMPGLTGWHWALAILPLGLATAAALGAARTYPGQVGGWLAVAMVLLTGSQLHAAIWPSAYGPLVTMASVLRVAFTAVVALGAVLELRHVAAERAAALAAEREYSRRLADLVDLKKALSAELDHHLGATADAPRRPGSPTRNRPSAPEEVSGGHTTRAPAAHGHHPMAARPGAGRLSVRRRRQRPGPERRLGGRTAARPRGRRRPAPAAAGARCHLLLVDGHAMTREALAARLRREPGIAVVEARSGAEACRALGVGPVDLAVVALDLPEADGVEVVRAIRAAYPQAAVVGLAPDADRDRLARAVEAGAAGVVPKTAPARELVQAVRRLRDGQRLLAPAEAVDLLRAALETRARGEEAAQRLDRLTPREREVLQALAIGLSDKEIAARLHLSPKTVRFHVVNVLAKLGVDSRLQAVIFAARHGAVDIR